MGSSIVILGAGAAALSAVEALREQGHTGPITLLADVDKPYSPVLTSYYAAGKIPREQCFIWEEDFNAASGLDFHGGPDAKVVSLRPETHEVETVDGSVFTYDTCLVATGASPVPLEEGAGIDPERVLYLRTMADADRFHQVLDEGEPLLVSGSSLVALKAAEAAVERGVPVTLLVRSSQILRSMAHPQVSARLQSYLEEKGIAFRLETTLDSLEDLDSFGHVLLAHGVRPNLDFVPEGALEQDAGLLVDEHLQTSDSNIYAAGDVAQLRGSAVAGLWGVARYQGRCAGQNMAGIDAVIPPAARISASTLPVCGGVLVSAGTLAEEEGTRIDMREFGNGRLGAFAYGMGEKKQEESSFASLVLSELGLKNPRGEHLVGFNLWDPAPETTSPLLRASAFLHQSILDS